MADSQPRGTVGGVDQTGSIDSDESRQAASGPASRRSLRPEKRTTNIVSSTPVNRCVSPGDELYRVRAPEVPARGLEIPCSPT